MKKLLIGMILTLFTLTLGYCEGTVETWDPESGSGTLGPGGVVSKRIDEIITEPDDFPVQEEDDKLFYCMLDFYENEEGEIFIIDEDGSVIRVSDT